MSRTLSLTFRQSHNAEASGEVDVLLLTISHPALTAILGGPLRLSSDPTERFSDNPIRYGTTSRGDQYDFLPFSWVAPEEGEEAPSDIQLAIANFDISLIQLIRSTSTPASVTMELVAATSPDDVEITWPEFDLSNSSYDDQAVTLSLAIDSLVTEQVPADSFTPATFPGLF